MKSKRKKSVMVLLFGIGFILGGVVSIVTAVIGVSQVSNAKYKEQVTASVISKKVENNRIDRSDTSTIKTDSLEWITQEEMEIDGNTITYEGHYHIDPEGEIVHTLISNDGINWEVNDSSPRTIIFSAIAGIICILVGVFAIKRA